MVKPTAIIIKSGINITEGITIPLKIPNTIKTIRNNSINKNKYPDSGE
jgi:hypothetical protein